MAEVISSMAQNIKNICDVTWKKKIINKKDKECKKIKIKNKKIIKNKYLKKIIKNKYLKKIIKNKYLKKIIKCISMVEY